MNLSAQLNDQSLADLHSQWQLDGTRLALHRLNGDLLSGSVNGKGNIDLADREHATFDIDWHGLDPTLLSPVAAPLQETEGTLAGSIKLAPTDDPHPIGPLQLTLQLNQTGATYRGLPLGVGKATAYLDPEPANHQPRYVLHDMKVQAAGGELDLWGRVSWHDHATAEQNTSEQRGSEPADAGGRWYVFAKGKAKQFDLKMVTQTLRPQAEPMLGRVDAEATVISPLEDWSVASGHGSMSLTKSDLANLPIISLLYDLANVRFGKQKPEGEGEARFRVEDGLLVFDRFHYTNRGTQIELAGKVQDIWAGDASPIRGYAMVSVAPLPDVALLDTINKALSQLQTDAIVVRIDGTLAEPKRIPCRSSGCSRPSAERCWVRNMKSPIVRKTPRRSRRNNELGYQSRVPQMLASVMRKRSACPRSSFNDVHSLSHSPARKGGVRLRPPCAQQHATKIQGSTPRFRGGLLACSRARD